MVPTMEEAEILLASGKDQLVVYTDTHSHAHFFQRCSFQTHLDALSRLSALFMVQGRIVEDIPPSHPN